MDATALHAMALRLAAEGQAARKVYTQAAQILDMYSDGRDGSGAGAVKIVVKENVAKISGMCQDEVAANISEAQQNAAPRRSTRPLRKPDRLTF